MTHQDEPKKERKKRVQDQELTAMRKITQAFDEIEDAETRQRVIDWVHGRYPKT